MNSCRSALIQLAMSAALAWLGCANASGADYPTRPVSLVVAFPPGGGADTQARLIAKGLAERLGKPVVVENRPGAGGALGTSVVARAAPDGHTLLIGSSSTLVLEPLLRPDSGIDALRDFAPVTVAAEMPLVLTVSPTLGVRTVSEFLALARKKPRQFTYASFGVGTTAHLAGEMLKTSAHVDLVHVPYKGSPEALVDLIGGQVSCAFTTTISAMGNIRAGKVVPLAVTGSKRLPTLPKVPTLAESGVPGFNLEIWFAVLAPAKVPPEVLARLSKEIVSVLRSTDVTRAVEEQGGIVIASEPGEVTRRLRTDVASISRLVKAANLHIAE
jgi:tripartite-type tricarboxylate transporter receptor subunit TctC